MIRARRPSRSTWNTVRSVAPAICQSRSETAAPSPLSASNRSSVWSSRSWRRAGRRRSRSLAHHDGAARGVGALTVAAPGLGARSSSSGAVSPPRSGRSTSARPERGQDPYELDLSRRLRLLKYCAQLRANGCEAAAEDPRGRGGRSARRVDCGRDGLTKGSRVRGVVGNEAPRVEKRPSRLCKRASAVEFVITRRPAASTTRTANGSASMPTRSRASASARSRAASWRSRIMRVRCGISWLHGAPRGSHLRWARNVASF